MKAPGAPAFAGRHASGVRAGQSSTKSSRRSRGTISETQAPATHVSPGSVHVGPARPPAGGVVTHDGSSWRRRSLCVGPGNAAVCAVRTTTGRVVPGSSVVKPSTRTDTPVPTLFASTATVRGKTAPCDARNMASVCFSPPTVVTTWSDCTYAPSPLLWMPTSSSLGLDRWHDEDAQEEQRPHRTVPSKYFFASATASLPTAAPSLRPAKSSALMWMPPQTRDCPAWSAASS